MVFTDAEIAALDRDLQRIGIFFRLATDPVTRLWVGFGDIAPGVNILDTDDAIYKGLGQIANVPPLGQLISGQADRIELSISGALPPAAMAGTGQASVEGLAAALGIALMDSDWQLLGPIRWVRMLTADVLTASEQSPDNVSDPVVRQISLSLGTRMTGRRRPALSYLVDYEQKRLSAEINPAANPDRFCERTILYSQDARKTWPRF